MSTIEYPLSLAFNIMLTVIKEWTKTNLHSPKAAKFCKKQQKDTTFTRGICLDVEGQIQVEAQNHRFNAGACLTSMSVLSCSSPQARWVFLVALRQKGREFHNKKERNKERESKTSPSGPKTSVTVNLFYVVASILSCCLKTLSQHPNATLNSRRELFWIYGETWQFDLLQDVLHVNECSCQEFLKMTVSPT